MRMLTADEQIVVDGIVRNITILAKTYGAGNREVQLSSAGRITFGRYIECKWALGYVLLLCSGERDQAENRNRVFEAANVYLCRVAPEAMIIPHEPRS